MECMQRAGRVSLCVMALLIEGCKRGDEPSPEIRADGLYLAGQSAFAAGKFADAIAQFEEVKKINPGDKRLPAAFGEAYLGAANLTEAIKAFENASRLDPKRGTTWSRLAYLYVVTNDGPQAEHAMSKALEINGQDFNTLEAMGDLRLKQERVSEAVEAFQQAAQCAPPARRSELVLRAVEELMKTNASSKALAVLDGAVDAGISSGPLLAEYGDRLVEAQRLEEAGRAYRHAALALPKDPTLFELVGEIEARLGRPDEAKKAFGQSLQVQNRSLVHLALAKIFDSEKDSIGAQREFALALETATGQEVRETTELSDYLFAKGRKKESLALLLNLSEEPTERNNLTLQLNVAKMARELKDETAVKAACARALASQPAASRCP
jgi:Flp pilus assembly protein TadD